jgi:hypothetical protein
MHTKTNGYVSGALLAMPFAKRFRKHVEYEKFLCRMLVDNDITKEFKKSTSALKDKIYAMRYNSPIAEALTAAGRKKNAKLEKS